MPTEHKRNQVFVTDIFRKFGAFKFSTSNYNGMEIDIQHNEYNDDANSRLKIPSVPVQYMHSFTCTTRDTYTHTQRQAAQ